MSREHPVISGLGEGIAATAIDALALPAEPSANEPACARPGPIPAAPALDVPSGHVWPGSRGREWLAEASADPPRVFAAMDAWRASTRAGWMFHSPLAAAFNDPELGRAALLAMARRHAHHARVLSTPRAVVLAPDGHGRWRLWQVLRRHRSVREQLTRGLDQHDATAVAEVLIEGARRLAEIEARLEVDAVGTLRIDLDGVGVIDGTTRFIGIFAEHRPAAGGLDVLGRALGPLLVGWQVHRPALIEALRGCHAMALMSDHEIIERLLQLLDQR